MYALWKKLSKLEDVLNDSVDEIVEYFKANYSTHPQKIRWMLSERTLPLTSRSFEEFNDDSLSFHLLPESDLKFDSSSDYLGFIMCSYRGENEFHLNGQDYQRGNILIKNMENLPLDDSISQHHKRNELVYFNCYKAYLDDYFKNTSYEGLLGLGIMYEDERWNFNVLVIGSDRNRTLFSLEERSLLEMYILSWTKNMHEQGSIRSTAWKMLDQQFLDIQRLVETKQSEIEEASLSIEFVDIACIFKHEIQEEMNALFQIPIFNTYSHIRDRIQSKSEELKTIAERFEHVLSTANGQSSQRSFCQIWIRLKEIEDAFHKNKFKSLDLETSIDIEGLFTNKRLSFVEQLGICPESDTFDPKLNYVGFFIYLYDNQKEFIVDTRQCKCGQLFIRQKKNLPPVNPKLSYQKTSFAPLFIHEDLYESYFEEKPTERFHGVGFAYEQGRWKFGSIIYAGRSGIHSVYDDQTDISITPSLAEEYYLDLALSTLYMSNEWTNNPGSMYTIDELETIARELFQEKIEIIESLYEDKRGELKYSVELALEKLIIQYKPESITSERRSVTGKTQETITNSSDNSKASNSKSKENLSKFYSLNETHSLQNQSMDSTAQTVSLPSKLRPTRPVQKRIPSFYSYVKSRLRSKSRETSTDRHHLTDIESTKPSPSSSRRESISTSSKEKLPSTIYQLWVELNHIEQTLLHDSDWTRFRDYLINKEYVNYSESPFAPPEDVRDECDKITLIKIDSQLESIRVLFAMKLPKLSAKQSKDERKKLEESFKAFEKFCHKEIERAKKTSKFK